MAEAVTGDTKMNVTDLVCLVGKPYRQIKVVFCLSVCIYFSFILIIILIIHFDQEIYANSTKFKSYKRA